MMNNHGKLGQENRVNNQEMHIAWWRNSRGLTLIELLAALVIFSMIIGIMFTVIESGVLAFKRTEAETLLREEGDYIMSKIIYAFYRSGAEKVKLEFEEGSDVEQILTITGEGETIYKLETKVETTDGHEHLDIYLTEPTSDPVATTTGRTERINQEKYILNTLPDQDAPDNRVFELQSCKKKDENTGELMDVDPPCVGENIVEGIIKVNLTWRKAVDSDERDVWYQMESSFGF